MKTVRADLEKKRKTAKKKVFGGTRFLTIFWTAKKLFGGTKMGQNHSPGQVIFRKKIEKKVDLLLRWCSWLLPGAPGHVSRQFSNRFGMDL